MRAAKSSADKMRGEGVPLLRRRRCRHRYQRRSSTSLSEPWSTSTQPSSSSSSSEPESASSQPSLPPPAVPAALRHVHPAVAAALQVVARFHHIFKFFGQLASLVQPQQVLARDPRRNAPEAPNDNGVAFERASYLFLYPSSGATGGGAPLHVDPAASGDDIHLSLCFE